MIRHTNVAGKLFLIVLTQVFVIKAIESRGVFSAGSICCSSNLAAIRFAQQVQREGYEEE